MSDRRFLIAPSLLSADFARLGDEIASVEDAGADWLHVDVMDGHFVPNLTMGPPVIKSISKVAKRPLDVHLMIEKPERYIQQFADAGAVYLTIHVESTENPREVLESIKKMGVKPGITLRPGTSLSDIKQYLSMVDLVLVMTVEPGFGGQSFMEDQVSKIDELAELRSLQGYSYLIEVDGGITPETAKRCKSADVLVAGSYIFSRDRREAIDALKNAR